MESPRFHTDHFYDELLKGNTRATQLVPSYELFRLGHGDPLLKASLRYSRNQAVQSPAHERHTIPADEINRETHLIQQGSPLGGLGINDVVHFPNHTQMAFPTLPSMNTEPPKVLTGQKDHLECHESPVGGLGFNDVVHLPGGDTVSVPILPMVPNVTNIWPNKTDIVLEKPLLPHFPTE